MKKIMAMEVTELMVGDWANIKGKPVKVTLDDLRTMLILFEDVDFHIEPIKLTDDILVRNGFVYQEAEETCATNAYHHWQLDGEYLALDDYQYWRKEKKDDLPRFCIAGIDINYVHQLQHLLRLCGIEKEIEL